MADRARDRGRDGTGRAAGVFSATRSIAILLALAGLPSTATATASIAAPPIAYTAINQTLAFTGTDAIAGMPRAIQVTATIAAGCNPTAGNGYLVAQCGRVELTLQDLFGGTLQIPGSAPVSTVAGPRYRTPSGAIVEDATDPLVNGGAVLAIRMNGTQAQLNGALAALQYVPAPGFEDRYYNERMPPGSSAPTLDVRANDGSAGAVNALWRIVLRVEGVNGGPTVAGPAAPLLATAGTTASFPPGTSDPAQFSVIDPELCLGGPNNRCGGAFNDGPSLPEPNDAMLLLVRLADPGCGRFALRSGAGFIVVGGPTRPSINALLSDPGGLGLQADAANAVVASLGADAAVDLSTQAVGLTPVFAGVAGSIADVRFALSRLTYEAPNANLDCPLRVVFSDLGNNGMPLSWVGPAPQAVPPVPEHEIPDPMTAAETAILRVTGAVVPDIAVRGNGVDIADGDTTPSAADLTDFGALAPGAGARMGTFTIANLGNATLTLSVPVMIDGPHAGDFLVTAQPASSVAVAGSSTFAIAFQPAAPGLRGATVRIGNNDPNENPFDFAIQGTGLPDPIHANGFEPQPMGGAEAPAP